MENITRHLEAGMEPVAAALKGAQEIGFTVFSISVSLVAVFIPILLMGGIVGRLFREFAITLSTSIMVSMVISLTTTPMMCAILLKHEPNQKHGRLYTWSERFFDGMLSLYRLSLTWVLENPALTLAAARPGHRAQRISGGEDAQGLLPAAGHRSGHGRLAGSAGRFLRRDEQFRPADRQGHQGRPCRGEHDLLYRRTRARPTAVSSTSRSNRWTNARKARRTASSPRRT